MTSNAKVHIDQGAALMTVESGGVLNIATGGKLQNNGVDMDLSGGIATSTTASTAELNRLTGATAGTAVASKALVVDANKDIIGLGHLGALAVVEAGAADGAIAVAPKTVFITKAGIAALTLVDPTATTHDGCEITFMATTANAHTVSNAAGSGFFSSGGASKDVATFGGAIGDRLTVIAYQGKWYIKDSLNITLG